MQYPIKMHPEPETQYKNSISVKHRKAYGQIFTPVQIAQFMINWVTEQLQGGTLLDPALGLGIFFRQLWLQKETDSYLLEGYEVDPKLASQATHLFSSLPLEITCHQKDFLLDQGDHLYDGIICNPPYIHFQDYQQSLHLIQTFNEKYQLRLNGFSNIYALFLIKSIQHLKSGGRAAFILPSEFLNADYGKSIKEWLVKKRNLTHLIIFDSKMQLFDGFLTTSAILLFEGKAQKKLQIFNVTEMGDLEKIERQILSGQLPEREIEQKQFAYHQLNPEIKWKYYYRNSKYNLHIVTGSRHPKHMVPFETFASTRRGIATGANDFFTLTQEEVERWGLDSEYLSPCLTRASHVHKPIFGEDDHRQLIESNKKAYLLNLRNQKPNDTLLTYLKWGRNQGYHTRYLTQHRNPWYRMEPAYPADLLVKTFGRKPAVFIQNQTQTLNLTCFHGIYFNQNGHKYKNIIFLYLITDLARDIFEWEKREYGLGLGKFEPNDIKKALVLDFTKITMNDQEALNKLYLEYHQWIKSADKPQEESDVMIREAEAIFLTYWR